MTNITWDTQLKRWGFIQLNWKIELNFNFPLNISSYRLFGYSYLVSLSKIQRLNSNVINFLWNLFKVYWNLTSRSWIKKLWNQLFQTLDRIIINPKILLNPKGKKWRTNVVKIFFNSSKLNESPVVKAIWTKIKFIYTVKTLN